MGGVTPERSCQKITVSVVRFRPWAPSIPNQNQSVINCSSAQRERRISLWVTTWVTALEFLVPAAQTVKHRASRRFAKLASYGPRRAAIIESFGTWREFAR